MGCAISRSRPSNSSPISGPLDAPLVLGPPGLPFDIYSEVLSHLNSSTFEDRKALLALALCCRTLRDESQRVLFSSLHRDANEPDMSPIRQAEVLDKHIKFLGAVERSPGRLALYVVTYAQHALGLDPALWTREQARGLDHKNRRVHLWVVTERVLPLMVNLKHLYFCALVQDPSAPLILRNCTFELESLTWDGAGSKTVLYGQFLPSQRRLLHLNINDDCIINGSTLPDGLCLSLTSITCPLSELVRIAAGRPIRTLHITDIIADSRSQPRTDPMTASERKVYVAALSKIRYLRVCGLQQFLKSTVGIILPRITILEVRDWGNELLSNTCILTSFPELRSLRLWENWSVLHESFRQRVVAWALPHCPKLEEVLLVVDRYVATKVWRFLCLKGGEMYEEKCQMDNNVALVWWRMQLYV